MIDYNPITNSYKEYDYECQDCWGKFKCIERSRLVNKKMKEICIECYFKCDKCGLSIEEELKKEMMFKKNKYCLDCGITNNAFVSSPGLQTYLLLTWKKKPLLFF